MALNQLIGIRLLLSQALLYVVACALLARALRPALPGRGARALIYLVVLFNPASSADGPATRVSRGGIYSSLTILTLGLAIGAALRVRSAPRRAVAWSAAGLVAGIIALTREEALWLAPSLAIVATAGLVAAWRNGRRTWLAATSVTVVAYAVPLAAVASINLRMFGVFELAELRAGYYRAAVGALTRARASASTASYRSPARRGPPDRPRDRCVAKCYLVLALHDGSTVQVPISAETMASGGKALSWTTEGFGIT